MNIDADDFTLLGLPKAFQLDRAQLDAAWKALQAQVHPDRFAADGAAAQRIAMQWAVRVNEAHQRLKDPLKRAAYLCELHGAPVNAENNTAMPPAFLMQQMEWREALDEADNLEDLDQISDQVARSRREVLQKCEQLLDAAHDYTGAVAQVRALMFIERFGRDIEARYEQMESRAAGQ